MVLTSTTAAPSTQASVSRPSRRWRSRPATASFIRRATGPGRGRLARRGEECLSGREPRPSANAPSSSDRSPKIPLGRVFARSRVSPEARRRYCSRSARSTRHSPQPASLIAGRSPLYTKELVCAGEQPSAAPAAARGMNRAPAVGIATIAAAAWFCPRAPMPCRLSLRSSAARGLGQPWVGAAVANLWPDLQEGGCRRSQGPRRAGRDHRSPRPASCPSRPGGIPSSPARRGSRVEGGHWGVAGRNPSLAAGIDPVPLCPLPSRAESLKRVISSRARSTVRTLAQ